MLLAWMREIGIFFKGERSTLHVREWSVRQENGSQYNLTENKDRDWYSLIHKEFSCNIATCKSHLECETQPHLPSLSEVDD